MAKLAGKIALISGGASGIGAATARLFQSEGATVIVTGSRQASVAAAEAALPGVEALVSDAADAAATKALVDQVKARHGRIDVLFVNAGFAKFAPIDQIDEAFFDRQFDLNVRGAFFLMQHAIPAIPDGGAIILTSSVAGSNGGFGGGTVYGATKAALRSFGRTFAKELLPRRIRVNTVSPGPIVTPLLDKGLTPAGEGRLHRRREDARSARPHRHARRGRRRRAVPRGRRDLHDRRGTLRRRRPHRSLSPRIAGVQACAAGLDSVPCSAPSSAAPAFRVSRLCLGTMTFGLQCDEPQSRAIMDRAAEGGIDFLDTADVYPLGGGAQHGRAHRGDRRQLAGRQAPRLHRRHQVRRPDRPASPGTRG